jgi:hypothetical protein
MAAELVHSDHDNLAKPSLYNLLQALFDRILSTNEGLELEKTREGRVLVSVYEATQGFFEHIWTTVIRYRANPTGFQQDKFIQSIADRLSVKERAFQKLERLFDNYEKEQKKVDEYLCRPPVVGPRKIPNQLILFKRWNSVDPQYPGQSGSLGGGYFLVFDGLGIVIDPGYEYLSQFFAHERNLGIDDVHMIIASHAHDDHTHDIETIYSLAWKRHQGEWAPFFYGSEGCIVKYSRLLANMPRRPVTLESSDKTVPAKPHQIEFPCVSEDGGQSRITMKWLSTCHNEDPWLKTNTGLALRFDIAIGGAIGGPLSLGITGDGKYLLGRRYYTQLGVFLAGCDVLIVHIGSPKNSSSHMEIIPAANLIGEVNPQLAILTEFPLSFREQEGRLLAEEIVQGLSHGNSHVTAGDSGLSVTIPYLRVKGSAGAECPHENVETHEEDDNRRPPTDKKIVYTCR